MNPSRTTMCQLAAVLCLANIADASFTGIYVESVASNTLTNTTLVGTTYKIYAQFDDPGDRFLSAAFADLTLLSPIYQDATFGTNLGPHASALDPIIANLAADSYLAVNGGTPSADTDYDAAAFAAGTAITGGWFMADPLSAANTPDANGRVLVMHLTFLGDNLPQLGGIVTHQVTFGDFARFETGTLFSALMSGEVLLSYRHGEGAAGLDISTVRVVFGFPAPGALGLLGVAGMIGSRRRRDYRP